MGDAGAGRRTPRTAAAAVALHRAHLRASTAGRWLRVLRVPEGSPAGLARDVRAGHRRSGKVPAARAALLAVRFAVAASRVAQVGATALPAGRTTVRARRSCPRARAT